MNTIFDLIEGLKQEDWDYYYEVDKNSRLRKPFEKDDYSSFIKEYIIRSGKIKFFDEVIDPYNESIRPSHICSVYFLGILICRNTNIVEELKIDKIANKYDTFTFIWFLIALFHDLAYVIEHKSNEYLEYNNLDSLILKFEIDKSILKIKKNKKLNSILEIRENYLQYRLSPIDKCRNPKIDHGIIGGLLLYDRLTKIRKLKKEVDEETLFWGEYLNDQYALAAEAITLHNIWLPQNENDKNNYISSGLKNLIEFKSVKFSDFPLFYILGIIDTIDPIKTFKTDLHSEREILESLHIEFEKNQFSITNKEDSKLEFWKISKKAINLYGWLDVSISYSDNKLTIKFQ